MLIAENPTMRLILFLWLMQNTERALFSNFGNNISYAQYS